METAALDSVQADGLEIGYRELGDGPPVVLLHGWPTSSFLWRDVMPAIARAHRVIAPDLPGFGVSDKPTGVRYDFAFFERALDGLLAKLGIESVGLAAHDLGGPIGVHWALDRPERVTGLALLNTLVYPQFSPTVMEFVKALTTPGLREQATSPEALAAAVRLGLADESKATDDLIAAVCAPFADETARRALADAGVGLDLEGFADIERRLPELRTPVRIIYGEQDQILPDVPDTAARVARDLPQARITALPQCGHFLQEEAPEEVGELLAEFFAPA
ncbi:MAG: alpha/beta fold hydrolase [Thermoleophilaceae bacterium]|nr:alpha/beta fold hydrolase [Thermoleophilaceae bacterium]